MMTDLIIPIAVTCLLLPMAGICLYHGSTWGKTKRKEPVLSEGLAYLMLYDKLKKSPVQFGRFVWFACGLVLFSFVIGLWFLYAGLIR